MSRPVQLRPGMDLGILLSGHTDINPRGRWVDDRDPGPHVRLKDPVVQLPARLRELDLVVDALGLHPVGDQERASPVTVPAQDRDHIGEVLLPTRVVGGHPLQGVRQQRPVEGVHADVDLVDRPLRLGRVLVLDDRLDAAVRRPDHPPVPGRVRHLGRQHRRGIALILMRLHQRPERLAPQQRMIAVRHDHGPVQRTGLLQRHPHRVPGTALVLLHHGLGVGRVLRQVLDDLLAPVPDDDDKALRLQPPRGGEHMPEHAAPAQLVQDLRLTGLHPGALARGENDDGGRSARSTHKEAPRHRGRDRSRTRPPARSHPTRPERTRHGQDTAHPAPVTPSPTPATPGDKPDSSGARTRTLSKGTKNPCAANYTTPD